MDAVVRHCGKAVLLVGVGIDYFPSAHEVGIHIDRVSRVSYEDDIVISEDINNISTVGLSTVVYAYLRGGYISSEALIIAGNCLTEEVITGAAVLISLEGLLDTHFVTAFFHGLDDYWSDRKGNVTDTHSDYVSGGGSFP